MKTTKILLVAALLCMVGAVVSCSKDDSQGKNTDNQSKRVSRVMFHGVGDGYIIRYDFEYDSKGRVVKMESTSAPGATISRTDFIYKYDGNKIYFTQTADNSFDQDLNVTLHLNRAGYVTSGTWAQGDIDVAYNSDNYYCEELARPEWTEYVYQSVGGQSVLTERKVHKYKGTNEQSEVVASEKMSYTNLPNNLNIDLLYFFEGGCTYFLDQICQLSMLDLGGKRSAFLIKEKHEALYDLYPGDIVEFNYRYDYSFDEDGNMTSIQQTDTGRGGTSYMTIEYK